MSKKKLKLKFNGAPTQSWSDLDDLHATICEGLGGLALEIQKHLLILLSDKNFKNDPEVKLFQQCFLEDFNSFSDRLKDIKDSYKDKKGLIKENQLGDYLTLAGKYENINMLIIDVLFKSATEIQNKVLHLIAMREQEQKEITDKEAANG